MGLSALSYLEIMVGFLSYLKKNILIGTLNFRRFQLILSSTTLPLASYVHLTNCLTLVFACWLFFLFASIV